MLFTQQIQRKIWMFAVVVALGCRIAVAGAGVIQFTDNFERPNGSLGPNWITENPGDWGIVDDAVVNLVALPGTASGNIALPVQIAGNFSVSIDSQYPGEANAAQITRRAEAVDFHIQEDGTRYHARYQRSTGAIQIGVWSPTTGVGDLIYAGTPGAVTASATDVIRLTISGDNTSTGLYTVQIENLTTLQDGSATFTTGTDAGGVNPSTHSPLIGGLTGFSSSNSYLAGSQHVLSFTATGSPIPEPVSSAILISGAMLLGLVRPRR